MSVSTPLLVLALDAPAQVRSGWVEDGAHGLLHCRDHLQDVRLHSQLQGEMW